MAAGVCNRVSTRLRDDLRIRKGRDAGALRRVLYGDSANAPRVVQIEQGVLVQVARLRDGARRDKTRDLKEAMMQELLTGRSRLA